MEPAGSNQDACRAPLCAARGKHFEVLFLLLPCSATARSAVHAATILSCRTAVPPLSCSHPSYHCCLLSSWQCGIPSAKAKYFHCAISTCLEKVSLALEWFELALEQTTMHNGSGFDCSNVERNQSTRANSVPTGD